MSALLVRDCHIILYTATRTPHIAVVRWTSLSCPCIGRSACSRGRCCGYLHPVSSAAYFVGACLCRVSRMARHCRQGQPRASGLSQQPVTLCLRHCPCTVPFSWLQLVTPSDVGIVADGVPALEVLDNLHRQIETLPLRHPFLIAWRSHILRRRHRRAEHQQDGYCQPCQCTLMVTACYQCLALLSLRFLFPRPRC